VSIDLRAIEAGTIISIIVTAAAPHIALSVADLCRIVKIIVEQGGLFGWIILLLLYSAAGLINRIITERIGNGPSRMEDNLGGSAHLSILPLWQNMAIFLTDPHNIVRK
jgi:hypothetical protein